MSLNFNEFNYVEDQASIAADATDAFLYRS
jgi:hypothetical protein